MIFVAHSKNFFQMNIRILENLYVHCELLDTYVFPDNIGCILMNMSFDIINHLEYLHNSVNQ